MRYFSMSYICGVIVCAVFVAGCGSGPLIKGANYYYSKGVQLAENDHFDEATRCFRKVLELKPNHPTAHYNLGVIYDEKVMPEEAMAEYRKAIQIDPRNYEAWYKLGMVEGLEGNDREAMRCFQEVLKLEPKHPGAHYNLAVLSDERGDEKKAIEHYKKAVEISPENYQALNNLGLVYARRQNDALAIDAFKKAKRARPDLCEAYNNLGVLCAKKGDFESAVSQFEKAVEINRKNADGYYNLAYIYKDHLHEYKKAQAAIETFLRLKPDAPQAAELRKSLQEITSAAAKTHGELYAQKNDDIRRDVKRFIDSVNVRNFGDFYELQPDEMRKHVSRERWARDLIELTGEMRDAQKRSVMEILGFSEIGTFQITGIEMVSPKKAKVTLAVVVQNEAAEEGEWREKTASWDEFNGRWAPSKFMNRIRINWESAKQRMRNGGD